MRERLNLWIFQRSFPYRVVQLGQPLPLPKRESTKKPGEKNTTGWWLSFNPSEKYARQIGNHLPQFSGWTFKKTNLSNHHQSTIIFTKSSKTSGEVIPQNLANFNFSLPWQNDVDHDLHQQKSGLVGGFNPFQKYARQIGSFPQIGLKTKCLKFHHPVVLSTLWFGGFERVL